MKKITKIAAAVLLTFSFGLSVAFAQAPEKMSYQAVIRDASNNLVISQSVGMQISILQTDANGTVVYAETQNPTTNANGLVSLEIGTGAVVSGDFTAIDWANDTYFIKTEIDPSTDGGTNYTITGTSQLLSVPYALHAKTAESITGTITETDPVFGTSVAGGITSSDISNWNNHTVDTDTHIDSVGIAGLGYVAGTHTVNTDAQTLTVSQTGDTLTINGGNSVLVPGISLLNFPPPPAIGDNFAGGIVAYILQPGDPGYDANVTHGLIAAPTDQSSGIFWHATNSGAIGTTGSAIGTGAANTAAIIALYGTEANAAKLCDDLVIGIYSDWYLPSLYELKKLYINRVAIGGFDTSNTLSSYYWSSTELNTQEALCYAFDIGFEVYYNKDFILSVRAVRAF